MKQIDLRKQPVSPLKNDEVFATTILPNGDELVMLKIKYKDFFDFQINQPRTMEEILCRALVLNGHKVSVKEIECFDVSVVVGFITPNIELQFTPLK